jgi:hypothetical protein
MTIEQRQEGLAQIHDLRRRLAERDFSDITPDDPDAADAAVVDIENRIRRTQAKKYDPAHPVMSWRRDIDG